ncbi:MAG: hypothetical protein LBT09_02785 [Planctomycetaceae bacterium]|nr:hypothetical protein [Planctomycetaceae bacterium]
MKKINNYSFAAKPHKVDDPFAERQCRLIIVQTENRLMLLFRLIIIALKFKSTGLTFERRTTGN